MTTCYLGLGSNIAPLDNLRSGLQALQQAFGAVQVSAAYRSPAYGFEGADFINLVAAVRSELDAQQLFDCLRTIEYQHGRPINAVKYADRQLDIDLLLFGQQVSQRPSLPREDILRHDFVLRPLAELAPGFCHPVSKICFAEHWRQHQLRQPSQLQRIDAPLLTEPAHADLCD
jgi:2-amino-4-hydroxy-6-hydroxymethyldihydropteridine diphosphokinase